MLKLYWVIYNTITNKMHTIARYNLQLKRWNSNMSRSVKNYLHGRWSL